MRMRVGRGWVALAIAVAAVDVAVVHQTSRSIVVDATTAMVVLLATAFVSMMATITSSVDRRPETGDICRGPEPREEKPSPKHMRR